MSKLTYKTEGDTHVVFSRHFAATPEQVYREHTEVALIQQWLLGPDGWTMPVCIADARPGGQIRYEWSMPGGYGFHLTGEFVTLEPCSRIVHIERMHLPDVTPDSTVETQFADDGNGTRMTMRITVPSAEARAQMLASGMETGMEASYARMEEMFA